MKDLGSLASHLRRAGFTTQEIEHYLEMQEERKRAEVDAFIFDLEAAAPPNVYQARAKGREYCQTDGSDHYIQPGPQAMDLIIACGYAEHFCLGSIIKYAVRFGETGNPEDLKKIADYAHILCGVRLAEDGDEGEGDAP